MEVYKGKCKCSCGKRAKYRAIDGSQRYFACEQHQHKLIGKHNPQQEDHLTEADYQTGMRL